MRRLADKGLNTRRMTPRTSPPPLSSRVSSNSPSKPPRHNSNYDPFDLISSNPSSKELRTAPPFKPFAGSLDLVFQRSSTITWQCFFRGFPLIKTFDENLKFFRQMAPRINFNDLLRNICSQRLPSTTSFIGKFQRWPSMVQRYSTFYANRPLGDLPLLTAFSRL